MSPAWILNLVLVLLEIRGLSISLRNRKWKALVFYTQLSNMMTTIASVLLLIFGQPSWVTTLRYLSVSMMIMTFIVTTCVLIPMGGDPKKLLWSGNGLYHHVICPVLTTISYLFTEQHAGFSQVPLPMVVTLTYGIIMLCLNALRKVDGPYPFFRVHNQSRLATVLWIAVLMAAMGAIASLLCLIAH